MRTEASQHPAVSSVALLASLVVATLIGVPGSALAGCGGLSSYQHTGVHGPGAATGVHAGPTAPSGSIGTPSLSSCPSTANAAITAHGAVASGGIGGIHTLTHNSTWAQHQSVASNPHTKGPQTHTATSANKIWNRH